jgi:CheY-like chemotaxis protein
VTLCDKPPAEPADVGRRGDVTHPHPRTGLMPAPLRIVQDSVLVVDDDESTRLLLASILAEAGHHVICAVDGEDALVRLRGPAPDLVILDLLLPGMSGWEVLEFMEERPRLSTIPIVILTAYGEDEEAPATRPVIHKPVDADLLCSMVAALLKQNTFPVEEPPSDLFPRSRHLASAPPRPR